MSLESIRLVVDDSVTKCLQTLQTATYDSMFPTLLRIRGLKCRNQVIFLSAVFFFCRYVTTWIVLSVFMIMFNKYILSYAGFPFPIALTLTHMAFCSVLSYGLVLLGVTQTANMEPAMYIRSVLPIALLFAGSLWLGNSAYLYLNVAFIQMFKALTPTTVYLVGVLFSIESCSLSYTINMVVITIGVAVASFGELSFNPAGILFQGGAVLVESYKLVLTQILIQGQGVKLNPLSTLYYVAPASFSFLCFPFFILEFPRLSQAMFDIPAVVLLANAVGAFVLNLAVYLLIGKASALSMNVAGVVKDWLLILLSAVLFSSPISKLQLFGYAIAFLGICWYNYQKVPRKSSLEPPLARTDVAVVSIEREGDERTGST